VLQNSRPLSVSTAPIGSRAVEPGIERQHVIVQHRDRRFGLLGNVQKAEGVGAEGKARPQASSISTPGKASSKPTVFLGSSP
jgi:hypothetical protein